LSLLLALCRQSCGKSSGKQLRFLDTAIDAATAANDAKDCQRQVEKAKEKDRQTNKQTMEGQTACDGCGPLQYAIAMMPKQERQCDCALAANSNNEEDRAVTDSWTGDAEGRAAAAADGAEAAARRMTTRRTAGRMRAADAEERNGD
jgi:hypothetical protein